MSDLRYATPPPEAVASSSYLSRTAASSHAAASSSSIPRSSPAARSGAWDASVPRTVRSTSREADEHEGRDRSSTGWSRKRARREAAHGIGAPAEPSQRQCLDRARGYLEQALEHDDRRRQSYAEQVIQEERCKRNHAAKASAFVNVFDFDEPNAPFYERESWKLAERMRMPNKLDPVAVKLCKESLRCARSALLIQEDAEGYFRAAAAFKALAEPAKALVALERARRFNDDLWSSAIDQLQARCSSRSAAELLPVELFRLIFGELSTASCAQALLVCGTWRSVLSRPEFWRRLVFDSAFRGHRAISRREFESIASRSGHSVTEVDFCPLGTKQHEAFCSVLVRSALSIRSITVQTNHAAYDFLKIAELCPNLSSLVVRESDRHLPRCTNPYDPSKGPLIRRRLSRVDLDLDGNVCAGRFNDGLLRLIEHASFVRLRSRFSDEQHLTSAQWVQEERCTIDWILAALRRCHNAESFAIESLLPCFAVPSLSDGVTHAPRLRHLSIKLCEGDSDSMFLPPPAQCAALSAPRLESLECDAALLALLAPISLARPIHLALSVRWLEGLEPVSRSDHVMSLTLDLDGDELGALIQSMLDDPSYCRNVRVFRVVARGFERWSECVRLIAARLRGSQPGASLDDYFAISGRSVQAQPPPRETTSQPGPFHRGSRAAARDAAGVPPQERKHVATNSNLPPLCSAIERFSVKLWADAHVPEETVKWLRANTSFEMTIIPDR